MNKTFDLVAISPWLAPSLQPDDAGKRKDAIKRITPSEARDHVDQFVVVAGRVAEVAFREKLVYVNLDMPFPQAPFTAVIFSGRINQFENLPSLLGKPVEISGKVIKFRDRPEIVIEEKAQANRASQFGRPFAVRRAAKSRWRLTCIGIARLARLQAGFSKG
jgi:hypothetical protein